MTQSFPPKNLVLYADDDPDDRELVREAFAKYSPRVELKCFSDGIELLQYVNALEAFDPLPCLIILDINMPRLSGKEVLRILRQMKGFGEVPIVLFTTSTLPSEAAFARSFDAGFVTKPLYTAQIDQLVEHIIQYCTDEVKKWFQSKRY